MKMSETMRDSEIPRVFPKIKLNAHGCLSLGDLIDAFQTPITEEHAWALCYESVRCAQSILANPSRRKKCSLVTTPEQLFIHTNGAIHTDSFLNETQIDGPVRIKCAQERKIISSLGVVIFLGLDYGIPGDVERSMSGDLESLLDGMVSEVGSPEMSRLDQEGIDKHGDQTKEHSNASMSDFNSIIRCCTKRLIGLSRSPNDRDTRSLMQKSDCHYKAVCRAYVGEALELMTFVQTVMSDKIDFRSLEVNDEMSPSFLDNGKRSSGFEISNKLDFADWARLWVQVIRDLRQGVKLKEIEFRRSPPIEYALTPYEMLMDDIRSHHYTLKKVSLMKEEESTRPMRRKDDAHALILDFIRSRPPLRDVAERILDPLPMQNQTPVEKLMNSIRQKHTLNSSSSNS